MKKTLFYFLFGCSILLKSAPTQAQLVLTAATDSVQVYSQWGKEKPLKKSSPKVLLVRIENNNPYPVEVNFEINFIDELKVVEISNNQKVQIGAAKPGKPKRAKFKFKPANYDPEQVDGVDIEIVDVIKLDKI